MKIDLIFILELVVFLSPFIIVFVCSVINSRSEKYQNRTKETGQSYRLERGNSLNPSGNREGTYKARNRHYYDGTMEEAVFIRKLDNQENSIIFGGGFLISEREKAKREKAEREKAEREEAERIDLSERERQLVKSLGQSDNASKISTAASASEIPLPSA